MIADSFNNVALYEGLDDEIVLGLNHLREMGQEVPLGEYWLSERTRVIVSSYTTERDRKEEYEAHRNVIDIQYPLIGRELVMWSPIADMELAVEYNSERDVAYWRKPFQATQIVTGEGIFAVFFPDDAHRPCMAVNGEEKEIKKVTVKIRV